MVLEVAFERVIAWARESRETLLGSWAGATISGSVSLRSMLGSAMAAVCMHVRAEMRERWRAMLGLALLVGIVSGAAIGAAAGARRTDSAYPRFLEKYGASHPEHHPHAF